MPRFAPSSIAAFVLALGLGAAGALAMTSDVIAAPRPVTKTKMARSGTVKLEVDGEPLPGVRISPLTTEVEVLEYQDGDDLFLRRRPGKQMDHGVELYGTGKLPKKIRDWYANVQTGKYDSRAISVRTLSETGSVIATHNLYGAFPSKITVNPTKNAWTVTMAVEQVKLFQ